MRRERKPMFGKQHFLVKWRSRCSCKLIYRYKYDERESIHFENSTHPAVLKIEWNFSAQFQIAEEDQIIFVISSSRYLVYISHLKTAVVLSLKKDEAIKCSSHMFCPYMYIFCTYMCKNMFCPYLCKNILTHVEIFWGKNLSRKNFNEGKLHFAPLFISISCIIGISSPSLRWVLHHWDQFSILGIRSPSATIFCEPWTWGVVLH